MEYPIIAVYDANVLYPAPLRDLFIRLAQTGLVMARWTDQIHEEWIRNVLKNNSEVSPDRLTRTRLLMNEAVRDCLVSGHEGLIESLALPDPDDRHVLAAAIHAGAEMIVTFNLRDFPAEALARYEIKPIHPDDFLLGLLNEAPAVVCTAVKRQRESLRKPQKSVEEFLATLEGQGLVESVAKLKPFAELIS